MPQIIYPLSYDLSATIRFHHICGEGATDYVLVLVLSHHHYVFSMEYPYVRNDGCYHYCFCSALEHHCRWIAVQSLVIYPSSLQYKGGEEVKAAEEE